MSKVLVTGGKGYLGSQVVQRLRELGEEVRILARSPEQYDDVGPDEDIVWGDIRDPQVVDQAVAGMDVVIHLVSNFRHGGSDKSDGYAINVTGTEHVLQAAKKHDIQRLVHCSTIGVHGAVLEIPADEETPFNPGDIYQETKLIAEQKVWEFYNETGLPTTVVRPISLMGPGDMRMLKLFKGIKNGTFVVVGDGEVYFQPAYIDDVVDGIMLLKDHPEAVGHPFIIGSDEYVTLNELMQMIAEELGVKPPRIRVPLQPVLWAATLVETACAPFNIDPPLHRRRVSFFQNNRAFNIDRAKTLLGYQPKTPLREILRRTIQWYRENGYL